MSTWLSESGKGGVHIVVKDQTHLLSHMITVYRNVCSYTELKHHLIGSEVLNYFYFLILHINIIKAY